jgi:predicted transcriptional regulator
MSNNVLRFPTRTPIRSGDLWHAVLDTLVAQYPQNDAERVARAVGTNPAMVARVVDGLVACGMVTRKNTEGSAA